MVNSKKNSTKPKICRLTPVLVTVSGIFRGQNRFLVENGYEIHLITSPAPNAARVVSEERSIYHPLSMTRHISPFKDLLAIIRLFFLLKKIRPEIIHTHTSKAGFIGMIAGRMAGVPWCIHSIAGFSAFEMNVLKRNIVIACEKITYKLAHRLIPNSFSLKNFLSQKGYISENKVDIIGYGSSNGVNLERFSLNDNVLKTAQKYRSRFGINQNDKIFVYVGRISIEKGVAELINAFLAIKRDDIRLILVGSFETNRSLTPHSIVKTINEHPRIHITGWIEDVPGYLAASDIMVLPTYNEGFPNVLIQGAAMELPCIATDVIGCQDIIEHMKTGVLVPRKNVTSLKKHMEVLLDSPVLCRKLSGNALINVKEKWGHKAVCQLLKEYYDNLLSPKNI